MKYTANLEVTAKDKVLFGRSLGVIRKTLEAAGITHVIKTKDLTLTVECDLGAANEAAGNLSTVELAMHRVAHAGGQFSISSDL